MSQPLRIAFFVHEFPAISETFVLNQIVGLLDFGCDVQIFANARRAEGLEHADVRRYDLLSRTHYLAMPESRFRRLCHGAGLVRRFHRHSPRPVRRSLNLLRYGREAWSLKLLYWTIHVAAAERKFDIVYCHFGPIGRTAAFLREAGAIEGTLVTAFHGVDVSLSLRRSPNLYRHLFAHGDLFLPVSRHWEGRLQAHGCDPGRIAVQHMGVELPRFPYRERHPEPDGTIRLLTVGRLVEKKGIEFALRAVAKARDRGLRLRYTIVGDGPLRDMLEALAELCELRDVVSFVGWCDQDAVTRHLYDHDVLVAPSVTDRQGDQEGIPVSLMEAMASGMPVISTRHSGIPELVGDEKSGLLVPEADVPALAAAIETLAGDHALRAAMGREGRSIVAAEFDARALNARLYRIFCELASANPSMGRQTEHIGGYTEGRRLGEGEDEESRPSHGGPGGRNH